VRQQCPSLTFVVARFFDDIKSLLKLLKRYLIESAENIGVK